MALSLTHSFRAAREVAQSMYDLAGPTAVFAAKSPFDRLLRDAITMSEHLLISDSFLEMVGTGIVGDPPQIGWLWRRPVRLKPDTTSVPPAVRP